MKPATNPLKAKFLTASTSQPILKHQRTSSQSKRNAIEGKIAGVIKRTEERIENQQQSLNIQLKEDVSPSVEKFKPIHNFKQSNFVPPVNYSPVKITKPCITSCCQKKNLAPEKNEKRTEYVDEIQERENTPLKLNKPSRDLFESVLSKRK